MSRRARPQLQALAVFARLRLRVLRRCSPYRPLPPWLYAPPMTATLESPQPRSYRLRPKTRGVTAEKVRAVISALLVPLWMRSGLKVSRGNASQRPRALRWGTGRVIPIVTPARVGTAKSTSTILRGSSVTSAGLDVTAWRVPCGATTRVASNLYASIATMYMRSRALSAPMQKTSYPLDSGNQ